MHIQDMLLNKGTKYGRPGTKITPRGICIHYTGNPGSSAAGNRNYFQTSGIGVSSHYIIGLDGEIIRCVPDDERAEHAGRSYGSRWDSVAKNNNNKYIGIECCHPNPDGKFNAKTYQSLIELCTHLCKTYAFNCKTDIVRHYDISGKSCPYYYVGNSAAWEALKNDICANIYGKEPVIPLLNKPTVSILQMREWALKNKASSDFIDLAQAYYNESIPLGIDPAVIYAQAAHETGFGQFTSGIIDASWHNLCGLKVAAGGEDNDPQAHAWFPNWETGLKAHIDHYALYAGVNGYPKVNTPDPRHKPELFNIVKTVSKPFWGATDPLYFDKLTKHINNLRNTVVEQEPEIILPTNEPAEWAKGAWEWVIQKNISDGTRPKDNATRQEVALMLYNLIKRLGE